MTYFTSSFNTQPPEGGWANITQSNFTIYCFNTQPPEGGWGGKEGSNTFNVIVSTHSRLKAAGWHLRNQYNIYPCFNTQPPEGGWIDALTLIKMLDTVSTHSRLKAAGLTR